MTDPVGVALIGTGFWARRQAAAVQRSESLRLVACYSRDEERRTAFALEFGCEAMPTLEAATENPAVQAVLIVTPNHVHAQQAVACAERGRHVFVEKPIADTLADGEAIRDACQQAAVVLQVGHCFRRLGAARKVKQLLETGVLGKIVLAEANFSLPGNLTPDKWRYYRETCPGGPLMQLGVHHADTLQYWLGPALRVQGSFAHLVTEAEIDDVGVAVLEFASGAQGVINSSYVSPKTYHLRLFGSEAVLDYATDMTVWPAAEKVDPATTLTLRTADGDSLVPFESRDILVDELVEFARCVRSEAEPETGAPEGLAALAVVRAAMDSHESGGGTSLEVRSHAQSL